MHVGDKDLITTQTQHAMEKQFPLLKPSAGKSLYQKTHKSLRSSRRPARWKVTSSAHTLKLYKEQENAARVATDVGGILLVVHVDAPTDHKDYIHRSGRTARTA